MELQPLPRPLGDWLIAQSDIPYIQSEDGAYWHYTAVLTLLKRYAAEQRAPSPVDMSWEALRDLWRSLTVIPVAEQGIIHLEQFLLGYNAGRAANPPTGAVWVRASERLPKYLGDPHIHYRLDGHHKVLGNFYDKSDGEIVFGVIGVTHPDYDIPRGKWDGLEWLDERPSPSPTAFAEWVETKAVRNGPHEWTIGSGKDLKHYTTDQLYNQFLNG